MMKLLPGANVIEMTDFPYYVKAYRYGYSIEKHGKSLLDSLLYTIEDPDVPDGMSIVMDIDGMTEWYDNTVSDEERTEYECPTIYDYLECEIGRFVIPVKGVIE